MNIKDLVQQIESVAKGKHRTLVGIAGPPASGKSTLAKQISDHIDHSLLVPMDGFHLENSVLDKMGNRDRKGAPFTFDAEGFIAMITEIKTGSSIVNVPEFDRELDQVVYNGLQVNKTHNIIIIEGNYLFLDETPWRQLHPLFDFSILLSPDLNTIKSRLIQRWLEHGYSLDDAKRKAQQNDLPNAELILSKSLQANLALNDIQI